MPPFGGSLAGQQQHLILTRVCVGSLIVLKVTFSLENRVLGSSDMATELVCLTDSSAQRPAYRK
jgi:hypothetical protein